MQPLHLQYHLGLEDLTKSKCLLLSALIWGTSSLSLPLCFLKVQEKGYAPCMAEGA